MNKITFESYKRKNGHDEFIEWIQKLPKKDSAKLLRIIKETEVNGMLVAQRLKWVKKIDTNLYELRSKVGSNIQRAIYFHVVNGRYVITHGFTKKTQRPRYTKLSMQKKYERNGIIMKIDNLIEDMKKDPEFAEAFQIEGEKLQTAVALYKAREELGLTQVELAERANTTQATIARIERGDNVSFVKLATIAHAMGKELKVEFA